VNESNLNDLLCVGDTLKTTNSLGGVYEYPITRVTKTLALSKRASDGYEYRFKRVKSFSMAHPYHEYNTTRYEIVKGST